jgi:hypothetical protein
VELVLHETGRLPAQAQPPASSVQALSPWWHSAMPHRDIREDRLDLKVFPMDLAQVVERDAVPEYKDADTFFRRTCLTRSLRETFKGVLRRLAGRDDGIAITQMATVFGGGKTHTLLALYRVVAYGGQVADLEPVAQLRAEAGLEQLPRTRVTSVDCAHISPSQPQRTRLWSAEEERLNVATVWNCFCSFLYPPMLTEPQALQQTVAWGVQRGLFVYTLGDGER